jgi:hypothetical protein
MERSGPARLAPDGQLLRLFDFLPDVSFFIKDRDGRFMALSLNKFEYVHGHFDQSVTSNELAAMAGQIVVGPALLLGRRSPA